ncbi:MAG: hypothetical protein AABZ53_08955 [Planctomycetota bacterium]
MTRTQESTPGRRWVRLTIQLGMFGVGLVLLYWVVRQALDERNQGAIRSIRSASSADIALLLAMTLGSLLINGGIFWACIRPVRNLRMIDVQAVNAVGTLLANPPGKLSIVFRVFMHHRRDHIPLLTIAAWFVAVAIGISAATNPIFFASWYLKELDATWAAVVVAGLGASYLAVLGIAKTFAGEAGLARFRRTVSILLLGRLSGFVAGPALEKVHAGFDMLSHPGWLFVQMALRSADLFLLGGRLYLCAKIAGTHVSFNDALVYGAIRFAIATLLPSGAMGSQEAGTTWIARLRQTAASEQFEVVLVFMLVTEMVVYSVATALSLWWLKPWRIAGESRAAEPESEAPKSLAASPAHPMESPDAVHCD